MQDGRKLSYLVDRFRPELGPFEELYRNLHKDPELSNLEVRTADIVASRLRDMGCTTTEHLGGHGVAAILRSGPDATGPCVMLRADMDALPIQEKTGLTYASTKKMVGPDGREAPVMHACGHDLHVACLLAVAALLKSAAPHCWNGTVVLVFQPAEEPLSGAKAMVEDGLFDRVPRPSVVLGHHCTNRRAGAVALSAGPVMAASDSFDVRITGRGGHGAKPQLAIDPVLISAYVLVRLQSIVSREVAPQDVAVVTCGSIHAGSVANVIPDYADLRLNVRTYRPEVRAKVLSAVERILRDECAASGAPEPTLTHTTSVPAIVNSPDVTAKLQSICLRRSLWPRAGARTRDGQ